MTKAFIAITTTTLALHALFAPTTAHAQAEDPRLGEKVAHCTGVFSTVHSAPESVTLQVSKVDAQTMGKLSMMETYALLQKEPGRAEIKSRLAMLQKRLGEAKSESELTQLLDAEAKQCTSVVMDNYPKLKDRIDKMMEGVQ